MVIGDRLRQLREEKNLSQGDIENRSGLLRCYISRVENGHTVPSVETLEKLARAMEVPMYRVFYDGEKPPHVSKAALKSERNDSDPSDSGPEGKIFRSFHKLLSRTTERDLKILLLMAKKMAQHNSEPR